MNYKLTFRRFIMLFALVLVFFLPAVIWSEDIDDSESTPVAVSTSPAIPASEYGRIFEKVEAYLATNPEVVAGDRKRMEILATLDEPMHHPAASTLRSVADYYKRRTGAFVKECENTKVEHGAIVWKLYNHTTFIKTKDLSIVTDLTGGFQKMTWESGDLKKTIGMLDVLLVTHEHMDHTDMKVIKKALSAGKKVIAPPWMCKNNPGVENITCLRDGEVKFGDVTIAVFPSFQRNVINNSYLITTADGLRIMTTGDENEKPEDPAVWYKRFSPDNPLKIDVLIINSWCPNIVDYVKYVTPKVIFSTHENEVSHPVSGRVAYSTIYFKLDRTGLPYLVPALGEKVVFAPSEQ